MAIPIWPMDLPQNPKTNYSEDHGVMLLRTPTDKGPAKVRRRGTRPSKLSVSYDMTREQLTILENFILNTLDGVKRFSMQHPRTSATVEVRVIPGQDGSLYSFDYRISDIYTVNLSLEILP